MKKLILGAVAFIIVFKIHQDANSLPKEQKQRNREIGITRLLILASLIRRKIPGGDFLQGNLFNAEGHQGKTQFIAYSIAVLMKSLEIWNEVDGRVLNESSSSSMESSQ